MENIRLLFICFELDRNSAVLSWQEKLAGKLSTKTDFTLVMTQKAGTYELPENTLVYEVPARPYGIPARFGGYWLINYKIYKLCKKYNINCCFIHMAHEWAIRLFPVFFSIKLPILLWYAHGSVPWRLRLTERIATRIITSTKEGFRINSRKVKIIGQAIDTNLFDLRQKTGNKNTIIYVGRISRRKRIELIMQVMSELAKLENYKEVKLRIVGSPLTYDDISYERYLKTLVWNNGLQNRVTFEGFVPQQYIPALYDDVFLHINFSETGSMDKTVMESLACGCPVLTTNIAFRDLFSELPDYFMKEVDIPDTTRRICNLYDSRELNDGQKLRNLVVGNHDMDGYVDKIMEIIKTLPGEK